MRTRGVLAAARDMGHRLCVLIGSPLLPEGVQELVSVVGSGVGVLIGGTRPVEVTQVLLIGRRKPGNYPSFPGIPLMGMSILVRGLVISESVPGKELVIGKLWLVPFVIPAGAGVLILPAIGDLLVLGWDLYSSQCLKWSWLWCL